MNHVCHATRHKLMYAGMCFNMGVHVHAYVCTMSLEHMSVCPVLLHACIYVYV